MCIIIYLIALCKHKINGRSHKMRERIKGSLICFYIFVIFLKMACLQDCPRELLFSEQLQGRSEKSPIPLSCIEPPRGTSDVDRSACVAVLSVLLSWTGIRDPCYPRVWSWDPDGCSHFSLHPRHQEAKMADEDKGVARTHHKVTGFYIYKVTLHYPRQCETETMLF